MQVYKFILAVGCTSNFEYALEIFLSKMKNKEIFALTNYAAWKGILLKVNLWKSL